MSHAGKYAPSNDIDSALFNWSNLRKARAERKARSDRQELDAIKRFRAEHGGRTPMQVFCAQNQRLFEKMEVKFGNARRAHFLYSIDKLAMIQAQALAKIGTK